MHMSRIDFRTQVDPAARPGHRSRMVAIAAALALAFVMAAVQPIPSAAAQDSGQRGLDADSARYVALGRYYSAVASAAGKAEFLPYEAALRQYYQARAQAARDADSARYVALGQYYTAAAGAARNADSARYKALGQHYQARAQAARNADSARWSAVGVYYAGQAGTCTAAGTC